jgi:hypothetical protein
MNPLWKQLKLFFYLEAEVYRKGLPGFAYNSFESLGQMPFVINQVSYFFGFTM